GRHDVGRPSELPARDVDLDVDLPRHGPRGTASPSPRTPKSGAAAPLTVLLGARRPSTVPVPPPRLPSERPRHHRADRRSAGEAPRIRRHLARPPPHLNPTPRVRQPATPGSPWRPAWPGR